MKRKLIAGVLCLLLVICMAACGSDAEETSSRTAFLEQSSRGAEEISLLAEALEGKTVILDAGHGFGDIGCTFPYHGVYERDVTLVLTEKIKSELEKDGVTVLLTHDGTDFYTLAELDALAETLSYDLDSYLETLVGGYSGRTGAEKQKTIAAFKQGLDENELFGIFERSYYANLLSASRKASLFVSVHVNANESSDTLSGFDLFCCSDTPHYADSREAIGALEAAMKHRFPQTALRKNAYDWSNAYAVNKYPDMPSVLVESGYATNKTDADNLLNEAWQDEFARAVADGIELYLLGL